MSYQTSELDGRLNELLDQQIEAYREIVETTKAMEAAQFRYRKAREAYYAAIKEDLKRRAKANGVSIKEQHRLDLLEVDLALIAKREELKRKGAK